MVRFVKLHRYDMLRGARGYRLLRPDVGADVDADDDALGCVQVRTNISVSAHVHLLRSRPSHAAPQNYNIQPNIPPVALPPVRVQSRHGVRLRFKLLPGVRHWQIL